MGMDCKMLGIKRNGSLIRRMMHYYKGETADGIWLRYLRDRTSAGNGLVNHIWSLYSSTKPVGRCMAFQAVRNLGRYQ